MSPAASDLTTCAVLGAGTMGAGIAQVAAQAGLRVRLQDVTAELAGKGRARIASALDAQVAKGKLPAEERERILGAIVPTGDALEAARGAELVIEAAPEDLDLKRRLLGDVARVAAPGALLATNTSSLSISAIALTLEAPERVVGLHFFNPPPVMKLLEIVRGERTSDATVALSRELALRLGKDPIVVRDSPGFASSRLGLVIGLEAMRMVDEGVASAADIDKAMELGYRHPMGPLKLTDLVGLDVRLAIAEHLARTLSDARFAPPACLRDKVAAGHLGKKSGRGFYRWVEGEAVPE